MPLSPSSHDLKLPFVHLKKGINSQSLEIMFARYKNLYLINIVTNKALNPFMIEPA